MGFVIDCSVKLGKEAKTVYYHDIYMAKSKREDATKFDTRDGADTKAKTLNSTLYMGVAGWTVRPV